ncbi:AraC family transcriptional regulator [Nocardia abscessus]|uniref:AraC family transcriptional regulator n=1 Tax=Nocardia abscessus TaxID=120957 RepID=UPI002454A8B4|nr:AraC family transcriptional regulator [Nocardia abscessus]
MVDSARKPDSLRTMDIATAVSLNTRQLNVAEGRSRWVGTLNRLYGDMDLAWPDMREPFTAEWTGRPFGDLHVSRIRGEPHAIMRSPAMAETDASEAYVLCMVADGKVEVTQHGRTVALEPGVFALLDCAVPFVYRCVTQVRQIIIRAPRDLVAARLPGHTLRDVTASAMSATSGAGMLVGNLVAGIASLDTELSYGSAASFSSSTLDILVTALTEVSTPITASATARRQDLLAVKHAIERRLHDPDHRLADIAAEVGMSVRYIQKLFAATGSTPRNWLYQMRLERARKCLLTTGLTVAEVSEQVGFRDVSHFSRSFRAYFGVSPGRFRSAHLIEEHSS